MVREDFEDLYRYMSTAEDALRCAYNCLIDYYNHLNGGLTLNGDTFGHSDIDELWRRITYNRDRINNIIISEINDKLNSI